MPSIEPPVFVIGNPRSGTTLLRLMLTGHPGIAIPPEGGFLTALEPRYASFRGEAARLAEFADDVLRTPKLEHWGLDADSLHAFLTDARPTDYAELAAAVYRCWAAQQDKPGARWGDKNNFHAGRIDALARLYPEACFLHIVRDGRDVACSYRDVHGIDAPHAPQLPRGVASASRQWRATVGQARAALARLGPGRVFELRYEELVRDPFGVLGELCFFLGEPFDESMLDFAGNANRTEPDAYRPWKWRNYEPLSEEPVGRFRFDLRAEEVWLAEAVAADALVANGYPLASRSGRWLNPLWRGAESAWAGLRRLRRTARPLRRLLHPLRARARRLWDARFGPLPRPEKWVFVVGCYNSGTTLLHDLLAEWPEVGALPWEGQTLTDELLAPKRVGLPRLWALAPERFRLDETSREPRPERIQRQWGAHFDDPKRRILLEKSPTNAARTRWLARHFENAHFVAIVRDGYAVAEGIRRKTGCDLARAARQWARSNEILLADLEAVPAHLVVRYEDLADEPVEVLSRICEFVGLAPPDPTVAGRARKVHERTAAISNLNAESHARLAADERRTIERVAGPMLERLGYAEPAP